jgi:hypothetical protein
VPVSCISKYNHKIPAPGKNATVQYAPYRPGLLRRRQITAALIHHADRSTGTNAPGTSPNGETAGTSGAGPVKRDIAEQCPGPRHPGGRAGPGDAKRRIPTRDMVPGSTRYRKILWPGRYRFRRDDPAHSGTPRCPGYPRSGFRPCREPNSSGGICPDDGSTRGAGDNESMKQIHQDTYDAMRKTHLIESAIRGMWI